MFDDWCNFRNYDCPHDCVCVVRIISAATVCLCVMYCYYLIFVLYIVPVWINKQYIQFQIFENPILQKKWKRHFWQLQKLWHLIFIWNKMCFLHRHNQTKTKLKRINMLLLFLNQPSLNMIGSDSEFLACYVRAVYMWCASDPTSDLARARHGPGVTLRCSLITCSCSALTRLSYRRDTEEISRDPRLS